MTSVNQKRENKGSGTMMRMYNVGDYYKILQKVGRGTYGTVYKAKGVKDNRFYAIKKLENNDTKLQQQGFPITALRGTIVIVPEITLLKQIDHPNIIKLKEIIVSRPNKRNLFRGSTFLVFEYMDHDFAGLFKMKIKYTTSEIKSIAKQLLEGVAYLHRNKILHRDIKSANILLNDEGEVKLADFGLGRKIRFENLFTYKVVTLWYRAPELLLGCKTYSDKIDVWSLGCVITQFFTGDVLFRKQTEYAQMERIYEIVGDFEANDMVITDESNKTYLNLQDFRPRKAYKKDIGNYLKKNCPTISQITIDFIESMLHLDPSKRMSCEQALRHPFFSEKPVACPRSEIQKMEYEYHEMFKDRSIKIDRVPQKGSDYEEKQYKAKYSRDHHYQEKRVYPPRDIKRDETKPHYRPDREESSHRPQQKIHRRQYSYQEKKHHKYRSSESSHSDNSESFSSSSQSSVSSKSERSGRSRSKADRIRREEGSSRNQRKHKLNSSYREREEKKLYERREQKRYPERYEKKRDDRDEKYFRHEIEDKRYKPYRDDQLKRVSDQKKRDYRDQRYPLRVDDKKHEKKDDFDRRDDKKIEKKEERLEEKRSEKRDERRLEKTEERRSEKKEEKKPEKMDERRSEKRDERKPDKIEERRSEKREVRRDFRGKEDQRRESKERRYESRYQKVSFESKDRKYYDQRDYKKRDEKYSRSEKDKYQDYQKHGEVVRRDELDRRNDKYLYGRRNQYKKKDHGYSQSSEEMSSHHHKKEKDYRHHKSDHYERHQRKNYYKKQHQSSNDHRH